MDEQNLLELVAKKSNKLLCAIKYTIEKLIKEDIDVRYILLTYDSKRLLDIYFKYCTCVNDGHKFTDSTHMLFGYEIKEFSAFDCIMSDSEQGIFRKIEYDAV